MMTPPPSHPGSPDPHAVPLPTRETRGRSAASRRFGYAVGIAVNAVLLYLINVSPGWQAVPFLTEATTQVLGVVNLSLWVGLAVNVVYLVADPPWLRTLGDLVTTSVALAVLVRLLQVFPFSFTDEGWAWLVRLGLVLTIIGTAIGIVVLLVRLLTGGRSGR